MGAAERSGRTLTGNEPVSGSVTRHTLGVGYASASSTVANTRVGAPLNRKGTRSFFIHSLAFSSARSRFGNRRYSGHWVWRLGRWRILDRRGRSTTLAGVRNVRLGDHLSLPAKSNARHLQPQHRKTNRESGGNMRSNGRDFFQSHGHVHGIKSDGIESYGVQADLHFRKRVNVNLEVRGDPVQVDWRYQVKVNGIVAWNAAQEDLLKMAHLIP